MAGGPGAVSGLNGEVSRESGDSGGLVSRDSFPTALSVVGERPPWKVPADLRRYGACGKPHQRGIGFDPQKCLPRAFAGQMPIRKVSHDASRERGSTPFPCDRENEWRAIVRIKELPRGATAT